MSYPDLIRFSDYAGDWDTYIDAVYAAYMVELVHGKLTFLGKSLSFKHAPATDGKGFAFWHAVSESTETKLEEDRIPDLRRCERITWAAHMLSNIGADGSAGDIVWWRSPRKPKRVVIWIKSGDYAVILEERTTYWLFWTAYDVKPHRAASFAKEHAEHWEP